MACPLSVNEKAGACGWQATPANRKESSEIMIRKNIDQANKELQAGNGGEMSRRRDISNSPLPPARQRIKLLVKAVQGRFLYAYCDRDDIDILFVNEPDTSPENALLGEVLLDQALPPVYRELHVQGRIRGVGEAQRIDVNDVSATAANVELYDALALNRPASERIRGVEALRAGLGVSR
jgi:hypothetical protein